MVNYATRRLRSLKTNILHIPIPINLHLLESNKPIDVDEVSFPNFYVISDLDDWIDMGL